MPNDILATSTRPFINVNIITKVVAINKATNIYSCLGFFNMLINREDEKLPNKKKDIPKRRNQLKMVNNYG